MSRTHQLLRLLGWTVALGLLLIGGLSAVVTAPRRLPPPPHAASEAPGGARPETPTSSPPACVSQLQVAADRDSIAASGPTIDPVTFTVTNPSSQSSPAAELHVMVYGDLAIQSADPADANLRPILRERLGRAERVVYAMEALPPQARVELRLTLTLPTESATAGGVSAWAVAAGSMPVVTGQVCTRVELTLPTVVTPAPYPSPADVFPPYPNPSSPAPSPGAPDIIPFPTHPARPPLLDAPTPTPDLPPPQLAFTLTQAADRAQVHVGEELIVTLTITMHGAADVTVYVDNRVAAFLEIAELIPSRPDATYTVDYPNRTLGLRVDGMADGEVVTVQIRTRAIAPSDGVSSDARSNSATLTAFSGPFEFTAAAQPLSVTVLPAP